MIKQLSYTLLTVSIISLNILPARALDDTKIEQINVNTAATNTENADMWCVYFPWIGNLCWEL